MLRSPFQNWTQLILFPGLLSLTIKRARNLWWFPLANQTGPIAVSIRRKMLQGQCLVELRLCSWLHSSPVQSCNYISALLLEMCLYWQTFSASVTENNISASLSVKVVCLSQYICFIHRGLCESELGLLNISVHGLFMTHGSKIIIINKLFSTSACETAFFKLPVFESHCAFLLANMAPNLLFSVFTLCLLIGYPC